MTEKILDHKRKEKPSFTSLIEKKRDGGEFTADEIRHIVDSIMDAEMPEAQQAALAMAIALGRPFCALSEATHSPRYGESP
ncbi:MAG: hypothetical protein RJB43_1034 [Verrucomicrobiota bacterium]